MGNVYEIVCELCAEKGISAAQMCREAGVSANTMTELKKGRHITLSTNKATKIAKYFGVSVGYLLGEETKKEQTAQMDGLSERAHAMLDLFLALGDEQQQTLIALARQLSERP